MLHVAHHDDLRSPELGAIPTSNWLSPLRRHARAYLMMNVIFYGVYLLGMAVVLLDPPMQGRLNDQIRRELNTGPMAIVAHAYESGNVLAAILLTFVVNLLIGCIVTMSLPSTLIPFAGIAAGAWRAALWGVMLSPVAPEHGLAILPHHLNSVLEGQAYVLAMLAAYRQGRWVFPTTTCHRGEIWGDGFLDTLRLYRLIIPMLALAAIYEAVEVIYLAPLLK